MCITASCLVWLGCVFCWLGCVWSCAKFLIHLTWGDHAQLMGCSCSRTDSYHDLSNKSPSHHSSQDFMGENNAMTKYGVQPTGTAIIKLKHCEFVFDNISDYVSSFMLYCVLVLLLFFICLFYVNYKLYNSPINYTSQSWVVHREIIWKDKSSGWLFYSLLLPCICLLHEQVHLDARMTPLSQSARQHWQWVGMARWPWHLVTALGMALTSWHLNTAMTVHILCQTLPLRRWEGNDCIHEPVAMFNWSHCDPDKLTCCINLQLSVVGFEITIFLWV